MPIWLQILVAALSVLGTLTAILRVWLKPLFAVGKQIKDFETRIKALENSPCEQQKSKLIALETEIDSLKADLEKVNENLQKDYKSIGRVEKMLKALSKAMLASMESQISGNHIDVLKKARKELQDELLEHI